MKQYHDLLQRLLEKGEHRNDRTGVGCRALFGEQMRFNLADGFPLLTTKKIHWPSVVHELLWFIRGDTNIKYLLDNGVTIWNEWATEGGEIGKMYGYQWRKANGIDQLQNVITALQNNPQSRRHVVSAWNAADLSEMVLAPCHVMFQFYVTNDERLSIMMTQRSADSFLGVPFNIASYALLAHMVAHVCGYGVGELVYSMGDVHLYDNHVEQAKTLLSRTEYPLPNLLIKGEIFDIDDFVFDDFELQNYKHHPAIRAAVAV